MPAPSQEAPATPTAQPYLTAAEVAAMLGTSDDTVYRMIKAGELTAIRTGRSLRITRASAQASKDATRPGGPARPDLLILPEAAALAGVSKWVICKHARTGKIRAVPWGKKRRYPRDQVAAIAAPRQATP
ncbi:MAG: Helix-turn-helix domain [Actinomycetia bacterium]|nr:Helix-turn-helix domain [Actinomycetes bacterium]